MGYPDAGIDIGIGGQVVRRTGRRGGRSAPFEAARSGQLSDGIDHLTRADAPVGIEPRLMAAQWMVADGPDRAAAPARRDYDFSGGPGVKAVASIGTIEHRLYGEVEISVVLALPEHTSIPPGSTISVEGRLVKVDPLLRNLHVQGAPV